MDDRYKKDYTYMKESIYKELFDLYHRDLKLITRLIYDWSGINISMEVIKYNKIRATISIFPQLLSYLSGHLLQNYKVDFNPGYVEIHYLSTPKNEKELCVIHEAGNKKDYKVQFNITISWKPISHKYLYLEKKDPPDESVQWKIIDSSYMDSNKYRADSRKEMSVVDLEKLILLHFAHLRDIPNSIRNVLDLLPIVDSSVRELEDHNVFIFPKFEKRPLDHEFKILWEIIIIPDTISVYYYESTYLQDFLVYLPNILFGINTY